jgi:hypothetical protein
MNAAAGPGGRSDAAKRELLRLTTWPSWALFVLAGSAAAVFAFVTVNLFAHAMASAAFLREHGWVAVEHGALWQVLELLVWGAVALSCWLVFKICEHLLEDRYIAWSRRQK